MYRVFPAFGSTCIVEVMMAQRVGKRDVGIFPSGNSPIYTTSTIVLSASVPILSSLFKNDALF